MAKHGDTYYADMKLQGWDQYRKQLAPIPLEVPEGCVGFILVYDKAAHCSGKPVMIEVDDPAYDAATKGE